MQKNIMPQAARYTTQNRRRRVWKKVVGSLACVVVFITTYALILPAITMEREPICGLEEHTHTEECYASEIIAPAPEFLCSTESLTGSVHEELFYDEDGAPFCGYADFVVHTHDDLCYDESGNLICPLPEIEVHAHTEDCYTEERTLICGEEEDPGHVHTAACYKSIRGELTCTSEEEDHEHGDSCYDWTQELICTEEEREPGHIHDDSCYKTEQVLVCEEEEVILHTHDDGCFDEEGSLICGRTEVLEHRHTEDCMLMPESAPEEVRVLICPLEEHTHTEECYAAEEETPTDPAADVETAETELIEAELPSGLPVQGTAYATTGRVRSYNVMLLDDDPTTTPLDVTSYVTNATLSYRTDSTAGWADVTGVADIPGNADFRLDISYTGVLIDDLIAAEGKMIYTLPDLLRNPSANGKITSGSTEVGTITAEGDTVTLAFDLTWLQEQKTDTNTVINGDFFVEAEADLSEIPDDGDGEIKIGDVTITIDFDNNIIAQYGNVDVTKTVSTISEETDGDYLTYTLTVAAGEDGCPAVKVVDTFTANQSYVDSYEGVDGTNSPLSDTGSPSESVADGMTHGSIYNDSATAESLGSLVWEIGDMAPNETRTLTYRVKLTDDYTGILSKGNITNEATVFSQTYTRDSDTATFTPQAGATLSKVASEFSPNDNGGGTITYTVWVQANAANSYTLDNVKIVDALDGSIQGTNATSDVIRAYLSYDETSFHLYQGGNKNQNGSSGLTEITEGTKLTITDTDNDGKKNDSFTYYVGSLAPGESKTLIYTVNVEPGVFAVAGNTAAQIKNRVGIYTDDKRNDGNQQLNTYNSSKSLGRKVWDRKLAGNKLDADRTITMSGSVFDATSASITSITNPGSFTVPAGSYQYQVVANETGDWDVSSASMTDSLSGGYMQFVGYVQVNAYTISENTPGSDLTDAAAIANLSARTPAQTVWVKVDEKQSFSFTPAEIGLNGPYAYLLTYYAQPVNTGNITQVVVDNTFSLSGVVGIGGANYTLAGIEVSASVTVEGSNSFFAEKLSWYYEAPKVTSGDFVNGALYWAIRVEGSTIPEGTCFRDLTSGTTHYIRSDSLVSIFTGNLNGNTVTNFDNWEDLQAKNKLAPLTENTDFSVTKYNTSLTVELLRDITLEDGQSLYIIVKTEPSALPNGKRDSKVFNNTLKSSYNGTDWIDHNMVSQTLYGSENVFKELGRVFTYTGSGSSITNIQGGTNQAIDTNALNGAAGTYAAWQIHVNYEGNLSGRYRVIDEIPEGMELAYVRIWWIGNSIKNNPPSAAQLNDDDLKAFGSGWTEHVLTTSTINFNTQTTYYYTNGRQVLWDIGNLVPGGETDNYAVEFQIVCRVTDPDVLRGGESKDFNNNVSLYTMGGTKIGSDSNGVTIQKKTLSKTGTYDPNTNGGRYPFKITLNELGEDLVEGTDTITLVDELSDTLILDATSIKVVNTKTGAEVTGWTSSIQGQTLKLILPDNLPLTITYQTTVNAAPGQEVSIFNNAHWEGYTTSEGGSVSDENFEYTVGGTVGTETNPSVTVTKLDQNNTSTYLSGAVFILQEGTYTNGTFTPTEGGLSLTGTTGTDGTLTFGKESGQMMKYNTVYCLTETKAPEGYVLDSSPHYFAIAKQQEEGSYPIFPDGITVWYQSANYTYQAYNHKGEAMVEKKFADSGNQSLDKINGTYRFGIYESANPDGNPLQTVTIVFENGTTTPEGGIAKFTNLELGKTYCIYELDDNDRPIQNNALATVDGKTFDVTYANGPAVTVPADGTAAPTVTVTNQVHYTALPETGGAGTTLYTIGGLLLMAGACFLLLYNHARRRKEDPTSS